MLSFITFGNAMRCSISIGTCHGGVASLYSSICSARISWSLFYLSKVSLHSWGRITMVSVFARPLTAAVMQSAGVTDELVKYLCLNHTAPDMHQSCEATIQIVWQW